MLLFTSTLITNATERDYYQIRIYQLSSEAQETRMDQYLEEAFIPAAHRAGIDRIGVFKPVDEDETAGKLMMVLIPFKSLKQFEKLPQILDDDSPYQLAGTDYIDAAHDNPPYARMESILLKAFRDMPHFEIPDHPTSPSERVYELRSYQGATEKLYQRKVEMFNEGGEVALFKKLEFKAVFFGEVISGAQMPNLMYMITFSDKRSQQEHWDAFGNHPDWMEMAAIEKYKNTVSHITTYLLYPTDYSDI